MEILTYGYSEGTPEDINRLVEQGALIVDTRLKAYSRKDGGMWCKGRFRKEIPESYVHIKEFGNLNYNKKAPIELMAAETGLSTLQAFLNQREAAGTAYSCIVLLCTCANAETCHRSVVAKLLSERGLFSEARHLKPGESL